MTIKSTLEQTTETVPPSVAELAKSSEARPDRPAKVKKKNGKIWPKKLNATRNPGSKSIDHEFSGRIEKINIKEIASGRFQAAFSAASKKGESRSYVIEVSEAAGGMVMVSLLLSAFAAKRKVTITTAPGDGGSLRIVEVEVRK